MESPQEKRKVKVENGNRFKGLSQISKKLDLDKFSRKWQQVQRT